MSTAAGLDYLIELAHSLLRQGFRRQVWVGAHGPTFLTLATLANDFFHQTGVPIAQMDRVGMPKANLSPLGTRDMSSMVKGVHSRTLGAYRIMGRLDEIIIDPNTKEEYSFDSTAWGYDETEAYNYIFNFGPLSGQVGFYQNRPQCHGLFVGAARSREELEQYSLEGERQLRAAIDETDIDGILEDLRKLDREVNDNILKNYPHLPAVQRCI